MTNIGETLAVVTVEPLTLETTAHEEVAAAVADVEVVEPVLA